MAIRCWVDWDDEAFPRIRPASEAPDHVTQLKSFRQCQLQIIKRAREERNHWLAIINRTKDLTESKVLRGQN